MIDALAEFAARIFRHASLRWSRGSGSARLLDRCAGRAWTGRLAEGPAGREDIVAEELRLAAAALGRLTGRVDVEDILDVIFRDFCIGK